MGAHVVVLGAGVGGILVANRIARAGGGRQVTVVDSHEDHLFQPGFLHLPFNNASVKSVERPSRSLLDRRIQFRLGRAVGVDPERREVRLEEGGTIRGDAVVLATGSRIDSRALPGFREGAYHFYCRNRAQDLRRQLRGFRGGRVVVGASRVPYKCPPAPIEFTLLLVDWLRRRGLRQRTLITYVAPGPRVLTHEPIADVLEPLLREAGVEVRTGFVTREVDAAGRRLIPEAGEGVGFDLLVLVAPHAPAPYLADSGLVDSSGWVPVDRHTLRVRERVYALGDTTNLPIPKAGSAARSQSAVVAQNVVAELEGAEPRGRYDGGVT